MPTITNANFVQYYFKQLRDYARAAQQYATSDKSIAEVVKMFCVDERTEASLTIYLDKVLFDPSMVDVVYDECNEHDTSLADQVSNNCVALGILLSALDYKTLPQICTPSAGFCGIGLFVIIL